MREDEETPKRRREGLRQEEVRRNPTENVNDAINRSETGNLTDLAGSLDWKGIDILVLVIIKIFVVASMF